LHKIYGLAQRPPLNIEIALSINSLKDKVEVIRRFYFSEDIEKIGHILGPMAPEVPSAIALIGRQRGQIGLSVLYNLVRTMPSLIPTALPEGKKIIWCSF